MKTYTALFRGINVGGRNTLPMKALTEILETLGCEGVQTYIQSGNAVFRCGKTHAALSLEIAAAIEASHGFKPDVRILDSAELEKIAASNPFPEAESNPKSLHVSFLDSIPKHPKLDAIENIRAANERFALKGRAFYMHAPDGIGRSKLAANAERLLGVSATSRNWRTVSKLLTMAKERH